MANPLGEDQKYMIGLFVERMLSDSTHHQVGVACKSFRFLRDAYWSKRQERIIPAAVIGVIRLVSMYDGLDKNDPGVRYGNARYTGDAFDLHWQELAAPSAMQSILNRANEANEILKELGVFDGVLLGALSDSGIGYISTDSDD